MTKNKNKHFLLVLSFCLVSFLSDAQPGTPGNPGPDPDPRIPIDGGISLIIAAGVAYAAKKGIDKRRQEKQASSGE